VVARLGRALREWPPGLPAPLTRLIGRERDLAEVAKLVADSRLVTLVGSGGVGKTRLAIELAATITEDFPDGVNLVDLDGLTDTAQLWRVVAGAVGVAHRADVSSPECLAQAIGSQQRLLVLDNCESLRAVSADLVSRLLAACRGLRVVATSRERLSLPGEVTWRVPSLTFPWPERLPALHELAGFGAVALFTDRARSVRPGLAIAAADVAPLATICSRLDGIPLALELAAARVSALSISDIADRLDDQLTLLVRPAGGPARHQTLRASVEWSYQLLSQEEQAAFRRLAVFAGGWSLGAAEAVSAGPPVTPGREARLLSALVDKSLVQAEHAVTGTRYRLLGAIRVFAHEQLVASGELGYARARHCSYFTDFSGHIAGLMHGPDQARWACCADHDQGNFHAARQWCAVEPARAEMALRIASGLGEYMLKRGLLREGIDWLREALRPAASPPGPRAAALTWLALFTCLCGEFQQGGELLDVAISLYAQTGDVAGHARALAISGFWQANADDCAGSAAALDQAAALTAQVPDDRYSPAFIQMMTGMAAVLTLDTGVAAAHAAASLELFTGLGDITGAGYARCVLADCQIRNGLPADALETLRGCVTTFEECADQWGLLVSASSVTRAYAELGDWRRAVFALGVLDALGERISGRLFPRVQAAIDKVAVQAAAKLGKDAALRRMAGREAARRDRIGAALGLPLLVKPPQLSRDLPLTPRENEIAALMAQGLTNRQIAARLVIAERTVDTHVGRILAKLGCCNRSQVAAMLGPAEHSRPALAAPARRLQLRIAARDRRDPCLAGDPALRLFRPGGQLARQGGLVPAAQAVDDDG